MTETAEEKQVYQYFLWSVLLKGAISVAEIVVGTLFFFVAPQTLVAFASDISSLLLPEVLSTYADIVLNAFLVEFMVVSAMFVGLYLLARGLVKALLIVGMLKKILWTYPASLGVIGLFLLYQLYQIATAHSPLIIGITLFDLVVMYFIWREYEILKAETLTQN